MNDGQPSDAKQGGIPEPNSLPYSIGAALRRQREMVELWHLSIGTLSTETASGLNTAYRHCFTTATNLVFTEGRLKAIGASTSTCRITQMDTLCTRSSHSHPAA